MNTAKAYSEAHRRLAELQREIAGNDVTQAARLIARAAVIQLHEHVNSDELRTWVRNIEREFTQ
jgi:hypothetical protein